MLGARATVDNELLTTGLKIWLDPYVDEKCAFDVSGWQRCMRDIHTFGVCERVNELIMCKREPIMHMLPEISLQAHCVIHNIYYLPQCEWKNKIPAVDTMH